MEKELKITIDGDTKTLLIGEAKKPINPVNQTLSGTISAPINFWKARLSNLKDETVSTNNVNYNNDAAYVEFNYSDKSILLVVDAESPSKITVEGKFIINKLFKELEINTFEAYPDHLSLLKALRGKSNIFPSIEEYESFMKALKNYTIKINKDIKAFNDNAGNKKNSEEFSLIDFAPLDFDLFVPIFVGEIKVKIKVKVEIEIRNSNPTFILVSNELPIEIEKYMELTFEEMKNQFTDIVKIDK